MNAGKVVPHCTGMNILTKLETQHLKKTYSLTFMMERKVAGLKGMSDFSTINVVLRDIQSLYYSFSDIFIVLRKEFVFIISCVWFTCTSGCRFKTLSFCEKIFVKVWKRSSHLLMKNSIMRKFYLFCRVCAWSLFVHVYLSNISFHIFIHVYISCIHSLLSEDLKR